jgi:hypothetical protein
MKQPFDHIKTSACIHLATFLSLHEPIYSLPLHLHAHLALEEEPLEAQDLGLELSLQKNLAKKFSRFNINMMRILHPTIFFHIKTLLATQRR